MFRICIDPGHGEFGNPYPQRPGYYEGTQMYKLAQYQKEELEKYSDVEVILTRKTITDDPSLDARGKMAAGCDLFYSDHSNAADSSGNWSSARGVDIYGSNRKPAENLCNQLGAAIAAAMGNNFRGTFYRDYQTGRTYSEPQPGMLDYYGVIRSAVATSCKAAIIVEHGFHTNELDSAFLINDDDLRKMAKAEVEVLARYYGLGSSSGGETPAPDPTPSGDTYTVQTGDSLSAIGAKLGLDWREIAALNGITSPYVIYTGQVLKLPGGADDTPDASQTPDTYTVQKGDSLYSIGNRLGVSWSELAVANSIAPPYIIYAGQVLNVPGGTEQVATSYAVKTEDAADEGDTDYQALYQSERTAREAAENKLKTLIDKITSLLSGMQ